MREGRLTNAELAERVNLSPSACLRRVRLLEESGLIAGYVMLLDPVAAGLPGAAFVSVTLDQQGRAMLDRFETAVGRHAEISNATCSRAPPTISCASPIATRAISSASTPTS